MGFRVGNDWLNSVWEGIEDAQQGQPTWHSQSGGKLRGKCVSPLGCVCLFLSICLFCSVTSPFLSLVFLLCILHPIFQHSSPCPPSFSLTFKSRHWRQSEFQYVEYCQEEEAPDSESISLTHFTHLWCFHSPAIEIFLFMFFSFHALPLSLIFYPHLLVSLFLNAVGGQTDARKRSCQLVHCDDNDDKWHGWWLARLPGQIWPNIRQTAPVDYRKVAVQCVTRHVGPILTHFGSSTFSLHVGTIWSV